MPGETHPESTSPVHHAMVFPHKNLSHLNYEGESMEEPPTKLILPGMTITTQRDPRGCLLTPIKKPAAVFSPLLLGIFMSTDEGCCHSLRIQMKVLHPKPNALGSHMQKIKSQTRSVLPASDQFVYVRSCASPQMDFTNLL